jgi:hypothetical protein
MSLIAGRPNVDASSPEVKINSRLERYLHDIPTCQGQHRHAKLVFSSRGLADSLYVALQVQDGARHFEHA